MKRPPGLQRGSPGVPLGSRSPPQAQHTKRDTSNPQAAFSTRTCRVNPLSVPPPGFGLFTRRPNQCDHLLPDRRGQSRPSSNHGLQVGVNCAGFCAACFGNPRISR